MQKKAWVGNKYYIDLLFDLEITHLKTVVSTKSRHSSQHHHATILTTSQLTKNLKLFVTSSPTRHRPLSRRAAVTRYHPFRNTRFRARKPSCNRWHRRRTTVVKWWRNGRWMSAVTWTGSSRSETAFSTGIRTTTATTEAEFSEIRRRVSLTPWNGTWWRNSKAFIQHPRSGRRRPAVFRWRSCSRTVRYQRFLATR